SLRDQRSVFFAGLTLVAILTGCSSSWPEHRYSAFDEASYRAAQDEERALDQFRATLESKDFKKIQSEYAAAIAPKLKGLHAAHEYVKDGASLGVALDQAAESAIAIGQDAIFRNTEEAAEEVVQAIVSRYAAEIVYGETKRGDRAGWDRAFA